eukprot:c4601_g1_i2.p1 GENE.c4601_g1_i2~~c4601_g1_i2.p1  ORF type:complete len:392 (+),score=68.40 c4601_g1_i2:30-1205(+)
MLRRAAGLAAEAGARLAATAGNVGSTRQVHWWLRDESKKFERRAPLTPAQTAQLISDGHRVTVETSATRIFANEQYKAAGCEMVPSMSWPSAPKNAIIFALKELPDDGTPLRHTHVYFAHCFKGQSGAKALLSRFQIGGGRVLDLEFLFQHGTSMRVAAFGHMTGYAGAAMGILAWANQKLGGGKPLADVKPFDNEALLKTALQDAIKAVGRSPSLHVIGASGRCGSGAVRLATEIGLTDLALWDRKDTEAGGPFPAAFQRDIFLNAIYLSGPMPPFLTREVLNTPGATKTSVIVDVSCDVASPHNPLPIYEATTTFAAPTRRLVEQPDRKVDIIAIDHLPALLPRESSNRYAADLFPYIRAFGIPGNKLAETWTRAADLFVAKTAEVLRS